MTDNHETETIVDGPENDLAKEQERKRDTIDLFKSCNGYTALEATGDAVKLSAIDDCLEYALVNARTFAEFDACLESLSLMLSAYTQVEHLPNNLLAFQHFFGGVDDAPPFCENGSLFWSSISHAFHLPASQEKLFSRFAEVTERDVHELIREAKVRMRAFGQQKHRLVKDFWALADVLMDAKCLTKEAYNVMNSVLEHCAVILDGERELQRNEYLYNYQKCINWLEKCAHNSRFASMTSKPATAQDFWKLFPCGEYPTGPYKHTSLFFSAVWITFKTRRTKGTKQECAEWLAGELPKFQMASQVSKKRRLK